MLMVLVLSSTAAAGADSCGCCCCGCGCTCIVLVLSPERILEMSLGPRMSGRLETVTGTGLPLLPLPLLPLPLFRAALKSGRLDGIGGAAVLFPARYGVPESELGSRTLVGTGGGGGRWLGM